MVYGILIYNAEALTADVKLGGSVDRDEAR